MQLDAIVHGQPTDRPPLVIAHGLFGSARNWGAVASGWRRRRQVVAVDMRNHGDSPRSPEHGYEAMAGDLAETIAGLGGRADLLGHSMGGKAAMVLALTEPGAGAAADRRRHGAGRLRAQPAPLRPGDAAVDLARVARRSEADAALAAAVPEPGLRAFLLQSLAVGADGARLEAEPRRPRTRDAADHGLPGDLRPLRRPDAVPDRRDVGLRPPRALAAHPPLFPAARHWRSRAPATGSTPTRPTLRRRRGRLPGRGLTPLALAAAKRSARRSSSAGRARHS